MNESKAPIAVALDLTSFQEAERVARAVSPHVKILKVGLQTFYRDGHKALDLVRDVGCELFLDLKLHDIPNTVRGACTSLSKFAPEYLTVHAAGGAEMIKSAVDALPTSKITAVTALTSLSQQDISTWTDLPLNAYANILAESAVRAGAGAIVCSGHEVAEVRQIVGDGIERIVPGIRSSGAQTDDQQRTMSLTDAIGEGATIVVIGRPITAVDKPREAAMKFAEEYWLINEK